MNLSRLPHHVMTDEIMEILIVLLIILQNLTRLSNYASCHVLISGSGRNKGFIPHSEKGKIELLISFRRIATRSGESKQKRAIC